MQIGQYSEIIFYVSIRALKCIIQVIVSVFAVFMLFE